MKVVIVGGGIGGLTAALKLHARGIDCEIYEAAPELRELGVGINILPHAISELADLGLLGALDTVGVRTRELIYMTRNGLEVWKEPRGVDAGYEVPQFSIHRGFLQRLLFETVKKRLGENAIHMSQPFIAFEETEGKVIARFATGAAVPAAGGDLLIGADGIHSTVRRQLFPSEPGLKWNGVMMWRGAVETDTFLDGRTMIVAGGFTYKLVLYPIATGSAPGRTLMNWVITYRPGDPSTLAPRREDWNRRGTLSELMPHIRQFGISTVDLAALVQSTDAFFEYPMCDRDPLPYWTSGRATLLGDAAHPMYPVGSNGASQAIVDAGALATELATSEHGRVALARYDALRRPATSEVIRLNRLGGPEGVIDEVERRAPDGCNDLEGVISFEERRAIVQNYASTAGFSKTQVNRARH